MGESITNEEYVFGGASRLSTLAHTTLSSDDCNFLLSNSSGFQIVMMVIVALYLIWISRSLINISDERFKISNPFAPIASGSGFGATVKVGDVVLEWLLVSSIYLLFATKAVELLQPYSIEIETFVARIVDMGVAWWMLIVFGSFWLSLLWGVLVLMVISLLYNSSWILSHITTIKNAMLKMSVVWLLPLLILSSMEQNSFFISYLAAILAILFIVIYIFRIFSLFAAEKISILHCILYLCSVELLPLTFIWGYFIR